MQDLFDPVRTGLLPGRSSSSGGTAPALLDASGTQTTTNAVCVRAVTAWVDRLENDGRVPGLVKDLVSTVQGMFFNAGGISGINSSIFGKAPPIWQELYFEVCADGAIQRLRPQTPVPVSSLMPDQHLYHDGRAMNRAGQFVVSDQPVPGGDSNAGINPPFKQFCSQGTLVPDPGHSR
ncbi:hypothetical protein [Actinosynnema sp. NPDC023587]|uniref:hypothetical protein n=1 Tax=Actinosynnema sp. NPDC023587 TaxID=3154695 RepID=UPI0033CA7774